MPDAVSRCAALLGGRPAAWSSVRRGYTDAERWVVRFEDGSSAFVKAATNDRTAETLRAERVAYEVLAGANYLPRLLAWSDARPLLVLEDLSEARWPPPWQIGDWSRVLGVMEKLWETPKAPSLPKATDLIPHDGWALVAREPTRLLSLGIVTKEWLSDHIDALREFEAGAVFEGDALLHTDIRSDNVCFLPERTVVIDWNWLCIGNPKLDLAAFAPSLAAEGGPPPWELLPREPEFAAATSGYFAANAGPAHKAGKPNAAALLHQLRPALAWAAHELDLQGEFRPPAN